MNLIALFFCNTAFKMDLKDVTSEHSDTLEEAGTVELKLVSRRILIAKPVESTEGLAE